MEDNLQAIRKSAQIADNVICAPHGFFPEFENGILAFFREGFAPRLIAQIYVTDEVVVRMMLKRRLSRKRSRRAI